MDETKNILSVFLFILFVLPIFCGIGAFLMAIDGEIKSRFELRGIFIGFFVGLFAGSLSVDVFDVHWDGIFIRNLVCIPYGIFFCGWIGSWFDEEKPSAKEKPKTNSQNRRHQEQTDNDPNFNFNSSRFGGKKEQKTQDPPAPRGYNDRHPDDAKLWAIVDDPAASDCDVKNAYDIILENRGKRKGRSARTAGGRHIRN